MAKGGVRVHVYGDYDSKDIKAAMRDLQRLQDQVEGPQQKSFAKMSNAAKVAGAAVAAAAAGMAVAVGRFAMDSISAASDLEESQSKVTTVFGDQANAVLKWAETSATAFGQSKQQALEAAGTYGNLFQAFGLTSSAAQEMSTTMVELAADLASFNNTSIDDAIQALRSGLSGETEPLKRFGVALTDARMRAEALALGIYEGAGALDAGQKAQAAYALILKDTTLAQGDFARTSDGLANTQRILTAAVENAKAEIGTGLVRAIQNFTKAAGGPEGMANLIDHMAKRIGLFVEGVALAASNVDDLNVSVNNSNRVLNLATENYRKGGRGIFGFADAVVAAQMSGENQIQALITGFSAMAQSERMTADNAEAQLLLEKAYYASARGGEIAASANYELAKSAVEAAKGTIQAAIATGQVPAKAAWAQRFDVAEMLENVGKASTRAASGARSAAKAADEVRIKWSEAAQGFADAAVKIEGKAVTVSGAMSKAFQERTGVFREVINTQVSLIQQAQQELDRYAQSVTDAILGKIDFSTSDAEGNPLTPEQIFNLIMGDVANQTAAVKTIAESGIMTKLPEALAQKILSLPPDAAVALANYFSANPAQLEQLTNNYNALALHTETALGVPMAHTFARIGDTSAVEMIASARSRIARAADRFRNYVQNQLSTTITVSVRYQAVNSLPGVSGGSINVTARANGGPAFAGMPTLVGERGPELLIPSVDSTVVRGEKTRQLLGNGGSSINLTVNAGLGTDGDQVGRQIVEAIKRFERTNGPVFAGA